MRRLAVFLSLLCLLSLPVSAAYIPESSVTENRDGRQLIIKTYQLSPEDDPSELVDEPFDLEGYHYEHLETVKEDQTFHDSKAHTETVTVTTSSDSLAAILEQLAPTMEYSKDGYSGVLTLDHTTLQTEAAGYTTKYYTITDTKQFTGLPRNDPSYVPTTTVKDGKTLSLSNISWAVTGTGLADDTLVPTSYTATATYQATGSRSAATGYITTATYTGEITSEGIGSVQYTVTYLGTQLKSGFSIGLPLLVLLAAGLAMLAAILAFLYLRRPNAAIYAMNAKGVAYKKLGRQRIAVRNPKLDFTKLKEYPAGDSSVELKNKLARKLAGRLISIRLYDGVRTHLVEPIDGNETENYWFAVKDEDTSGRFYLRELEAAEGYILDEEYKTVYVRPGRTAEIEWVNEAITGQIQIYKYASEANPVTGDPAGTPLQGAIYEIIHERSGRVVDYITTDARGVAASKPLPLTRYKIREVTAPAYFQLDPTVHDVTLEYAGQIIKIAVYDKPANLKVTVTKTGNKQLLAGDSMRYDLTVANNSNVALENFYLHDQFPTDCSTAKTITTGTYNTRLNYQITYKTNYNDYRVLATNLLSTNNYAFDLSAVQLMQGEVVTDVRLEFGKVPAGFASVVKPTVTVQASASLANGYQVVNRVDAGGQYMSQWETGRAAWITLIVRLNEPTLPKTGY